VADKGSDPVAFPAIAAQLDNFGVDTTNNIWLRVRFDDGSEWVLEWSPESEESREVFKFFSRLATQTIERTAGRGIEITAITPLEEDHE
jgi:hypothetical protein